LFLALLQDTGSLGIGPHHLHQFHLYGRQIFTYVHLAGTIRVSDCGMSWLGFHPGKNAHQQNNDGKLQNQKSHLQPFRTWVSPAKVFFFSHLVRLSSQALFGFGNRLSGPDRYRVE
jgi:hypothetical protein